LWNRFHIWAGSGPIVVTESVTDSSSLDPDVVTALRRVI
jgi:hypothetical protein